MRARLTWLNQADGAAGIEPVSEAILVFGTRHFERDLDGCGERTYSDDELQAGVHRPEFLGVRLPICTHRSICYKNDPHTQVDLQKKGHMLVASVTENVLNLGGRTRIRALLLLALGTVFWIAFPSTALGATADVEIDAGKRTLSYTSEFGEINQVDITHADPNTTIHDSGAEITAGAGCSVSVDQDEVSCPDIDFVRVHLGDGDDVATVLEDFSSLPSALGVIVSGSDGSDELSACDACSVRFIGGSGNDILTGGSGDARFFGNGGKDILTGNPRLGILNGGVNDDTITGGDRANVLKGGFGADRLVGGADDDLLNAGKGPRRPRRRIRTRHDRGQERGRPDPSPRRNA